MPRRLVLSAALAALATPALAEEVVVFAAASLKTALDDIAADFQAVVENYIQQRFGASVATPTH